MNFRLVISAITMSTILVGCGQNYEYDGLYTKETYISPDHSVKFCTVIKGNTNYSALARAARSNTAIETNIQEISSININELKELNLKYSLEGEIKFTIGTDIASWKKLGYKPFETPCINNDQVLNFTNHISAPYSKKTKDGITNLTMNEDNIKKVQKYMADYKDVPVYGLVWEAVSGRKVDKGWVFKIES